MSPENLRDGWSGRRVLVLSPTPSHPTDYGNRKRIYQVCRRLREQGAEIHFLHYASESDWRLGYPVRQQQQMAMAWSSYSTIFPTRPIHPPPSGGPDHQIDEWWDPAIAQALEWMFGHHAFDAFLVNYTWLSKALEFAPRHTLRILDTHDRFSGRRDILETHGIAPEFFHTTVEGERTALDRADVVWAIKEQEAEFFRRLTRREVVVTPHADESRVLTRPPQSDTKRLKLAIVGARNNINYGNISQFIRVASPIFRRWLPPLTVQVVGSVCDLLPKRLGSYFEALGLMENLDDLYASVDAAIVPMSFSTGLKIKVSEALGLGLPVISHTHAFEGFKSYHPTQVLPDFEQIANTCVELAYDRTPLTQMAAASRRSQAALEATVATSLRRTGQILNSHRPRVVVLASARHMADDDVQGLWFASCLPFLIAAANVTIVLDEEPAGLSAIKMQEAATAGADVVVYPEQEEVASRKADRLTRIGELVKCATISLVVDDTLLASAPLPLEEMHVGLVCDVIGFDRRRLSELPMAEPLRRAKRLTVLASDRLTPEHLEMGVGGIVTYGMTPLFSEKHLSRLRRHDPVSGRVRTIAIFSPESRTDVMANGLELMLQELCAEIDVTVVRFNPLRANERRPEVFLREWVGGARVDLVVDLAPGAPATAALRELARRDGVTILDRLAFPSFEHYVSELGFESLGRRLVHVLGLMTVGAEPIGRTSEYDNEAGFAWLWRFISDLHPEAAWRL